MVICFNIYENYHPPRMKNDKLEFSPPFASLDFLTEGLRPGMGKFTK